MDQSPSYRLRTAVIVIIVGLVATVTLGVTVLNPSPTQFSAPHGLVELPEYSASGHNYGGPFYKIPAGLPADLAPGTVVKSEPVSGAPKGIAATRFLYVSQSVDGTNNVVSGLFVVRSAPEPGPNGRPIVAVAHGTTGISPGCGISQEPFTPGSYGFGTWEQMISGLVGAGFAVVATDYANLGVPAKPDYLMMKGEGQDVLNSLRAAYSLAPDAVDTSKAAILGHSQGGHAALSAAYVAPDYAPDLAIKGTVGLAPAIYPPAPLLIDFLQAAPDEDASGFLGYVADVLTSAEANYPDQIKVSDVFTPKGVAAAKVGLTECQKAVVAAFKGPKKDFVRTDIPNSILPVVADNFPIYEKYATPLLIQQGLKDTTVVPAANLAAARTFCRQGSDVTLQTFPEDQHSSLLYTGQPEAIDWLRDRFENKPTRSTCGGM